MNISTQERKNSLLLLTGDEVIQLLMNREAEIFDAVKAAYIAHANDESSMPPNAYLRFPGMKKERIIAKPAWLGSSFNTAGIKWIASFPENRTKDLDRASATLILNSMETGYPIAIMESSIISAYRTAASAALAAKELASKAIDFNTVGIVGCGLINYETLRFLLTFFPDIHSLVLHDPNPESIAQFALKAQDLKPGLKTESVNDFKKVLPQTHLISIATTAVHPFIDNIDGHQPGTVFLHTSLRDFSPDIILSANNIVDDIDQICSNQTSLHLAEKQVNNRQFIKSTIGNIFKSNDRAWDTKNDIYIFSPFGLGILDMALGYLVKKLAEESQAGTRINNFAPLSWNKR